MIRTEIAPGAFLTRLSGDKFKRCKIAINLAVPGIKKSATALALLPHVLTRRCAAVPNATELSRLLYSLYGAELASDTYTAGANRVISLGIGGLKNQFSLEGEELGAQYLDILCNLLFHPVLENGVFAAQDVEIEKTKQAEYLKSEMNDKRSYCLRQARRKLYKDSALGIESCGYLDDLDNITEKTLHKTWQELLCTAQIEIMVCGTDENAAAKRIAKELQALPRSAVPTATAPAPATAKTLQVFKEAMPTTQGKLCIIATSGKKAGPRAEAVMRLASALFGGLPTSRLFMNVREKQSLCYYCSSSYGYFGGTLTIDSGIDHKNAKLAQAAILKELEEMQKTPVTPKELENAKRYVRSVFSSAKDSPDALMNLAFSEWLMGTSRSLDEMIELCESVSADEIKDALAEYTPCVQYVITDKEGK